MIGAASSMAVSFSRWGHTRLVRGPSAAGDASHEPARYLAAAHPAFARCALPFRVRVRRQGFRRASDLGCLSAPLRCTRLSAPCSRGPAACGVAVMRAQAHAARSGADAERSDACAARLQRLRRVLCSCAPSARLRCCARHASCARASCKHNLIDRHNGQSAARCHGSGAAPRAGARLQRAGGARGAAARLRGGAHRRLQRHARGNLRPEGTRRPRAATPLPRDAHAHGAGVACLRVGQPAGSLLARSAPFCSGCKCA